MKKTKKIIIISLIIFFLSMPLVFAKTPDAFPRLTYIIGTHEFTPYGEMTTQKIMLAAQTIPDGELDDMIIYYKNSRGQWVNAALPNRPPVTLPEYFIIHFVDLVGMEVKPATITTNPDDVSALGPEEILKFTLATETVGAELYYTTNGQSPIEHGKEYTNQVTHWLGENNYLGKTLTIQAVAKKDGYYSEITTKDVTFEGLYDFELGKIIKYKGTAANVVIPSAIGGVTVDTIGEEAFDQNTTLKNVTIPSSVEVIEDKAFYVNTNLETLTFGVGSNLTTIGKWAFEQAEKLTALTIPESVTKIDEGAFAGATVLKSVRLPAGLTEVGEGVFFDSGLEEVFIPSNTVIGNYMFAECANLTTVTIGADVVFGDIPFTLDFVNDTLKEAYKTHLTGGTGVYKLIEGVWTNTTKLDLDNAIFTFEHKLDDDIWDADLKVELDAKIKAGKIVLVGAYDIDEIDILEANIENAMEDLFVTGFKAAYSKTALVDPFMPLFIDIYGNAKYEPLTVAQKGKSEAIGFINMEKIRLDEVTSVEDISNLIDGAVDKYSALLEDMNDALTEEEVETALTDFIEYTIDIYGDWAKAKKGVKELAYLTEDDGETYKVKPGVYIGILEGSKPYGTLAEIVGAGVNGVETLFNAKKQALQNLVDYIDDTKDNPIVDGPHWRSEAFLKDPLLASLGAAEVVLADAEATLDDIGDALEDLFIKAFRASHEKKGKKLLVPLFDGAYGIASYADLEDQSKQWAYAGEAPRFVNTEQLLLTTFEGEGAGRVITEIDLDSLDDIIGIIDRGIEFYLNLLDRANNAENVEDVKEAFEDFIQYTILVYDDWEGAKIGVEELPYLVIDHGDHYEIIDEVVEVIFENKPYMQLDEMFEAVKTATTERYGVLSATIHTIEGYLGTDRFPVPGELYADELDNALDEVRLVLANPTLKGIEESMENLFVVGFQAAQHKKGLQVMVPLFITAYGNANFEVLTSDQQGRDEALGFINMEKVKRSDFDNDGKLTAVNLGSVMSITAMIDDAVSEYWGVLNGINYSELEYIGDVLSAFVRYTVEVYDDWTGAYKNVTELAHIAEDNPLYPDDDPGEFRIIDGVPERIYAARQLIGLFDTLTEVVTAAATP